MKFRPCIDLHDGIVKQIVGSTLRDEPSGYEAAAFNEKQGSSVKTNFASSLPSSHFAKLYKNHGLSGGHVIMLGSGNEAAAIAALNEYPGGLQIGGGINPSNAMKFINAGASHVIVTSFVFKEGTIDFKKLDEISKTVGKNQLVLDLSCRRKSRDSTVEDNDFYVVTDRWQSYTNFAINEKNLQLLSSYCDEFLVHGVDVEGLRMGIQEDLVQKLGAWSPIPVTYAGGARNLHDFERVKRIGNGRVDLSVGSALDIFGGNLSFETAVQWNKENSVLE